MTPILGLGAKQMRLGNYTSCTGVPCPTTAPLHATQHTAACASAVHLVQYAHGVAEGHMCPAQTLIMSHGSSQCLPLLRSRGMHIGIDHVTPQAADVMRCILRVFLATRMQEAVGEGGPSVV